VNWDRVRKLLDLDDELETDGRLRRVLKDEESTSSITVGGWLRL
jgi:hypothetical protein